MKGPTLKRAAQSEPTPLFAAARHRIKPRRATHTNSAADWIPRGECVLSSRRPFVERSPASWTYFAVESSDWRRVGVGGGGDREGQDGRWLCALEELCPMGRLRFGRRAGKYSCGASFFWGWGGGRGDSGLPSEPSFLSCALNVSFWLSYRTASDTMGSFKIFSLVILLLGKSSRSRPARGTS